MPKVDSSILSKKDKILSDIEKIIDPKNVLSHTDEIRPYETDALAAYKQAPLLVVLPETVKEVSEILKYCNDNKIKVVPRGAGTGLSGGSLPLEDCILFFVGNSIFIFVPGVYRLFLRILISKIFFNELFSNFK